MARWTPEERAELEAELAQVRAHKAELEQLLAEHPGRPRQEAPQLLLPVERGPRDDDPGE